MDKAPRDGGHALRIVIGIIILALLIAGGAGAVTITVDDSGGADYLKIQDAINASIDGDTILVQSGTYYENVNVTKQLTLRGMDSGSEKPVVDAGVIGSAIKLSAGNSTLEGFILINSGNSGQDAGIKVYSNNNIIMSNTAWNNNYGINLFTSSNNTLSANNVSNTYYGITLTNSSNNTLIGNDASNTAYGITLISSINNIISGNNASDAYYGIVLMSSINNKLISNTANYNMNYGISLSYSNNNMLISNTANSNFYYSGLSLSFSSSNTLSGNNVSNNTNGIHLFSSSNNTLSENTANSNTEYGIYLGESNNNMIYDNFFNNTINFYGNSYNNTFNITKTPGANIIGGPYLGGNFWANPGGTGFSQTCIDANKNGICDSNYTLASGNVDYLPLAATPSGYGYISGNVMNSSTDIAVATVSTNTSVNTTTDASGFYYMLIPAGTYNLTAVSAPRFYPNSSIVVNVTSGLTISQDIELTRKPTGNIIGNVTRA